MMMIMIKKKKATSTGRGLFPLSSPSFPTDYFRNILRQFNGQMNKCSAWYFVVKIKWRLWVRLCADQIPMSQEFMTNRTNGRKTDKIPN